MANVASWKCAKSVSSRIFYFGSVAIMFSQMLLGVVMVVALLVAFAIVSPTIKLWVQAKAVGVPISLVQLFGWAFRRVSAKPIVEALIVTQQAGITLSCTDVEQAYLHGADVVRIAKALAMQANGNVPGNLTFQELVEADLPG